MGCEVRSDGEEASGGALAGCNQATAASAARCSAPYGSAASKQALFAKVSGWGADTVTDQGKKRDCIQVQGR